MKRLLRRLNVGVVNDEWIEATTWAIVVTVVVAFVGR